MKFLSSISAGLMLGVATVSLVAAPSADAKKEKKSKKKKEAKLKLSKEFQPAYIAGEAAVKAGDAVAADSAEASMRSSLVKPDDKHVLGSYLISSGKKFGNPTKTIEGLDIMIASPLTPPENVKILHYQKGGEAYNSLKNYPLAASSFKTAYDMGLRQGNVEANAANAFSLSKDYPASLTWLRLAIESNKAAGTEVPQGWYKLMARNANLTKNPAVLTDTMQYVLSHNPSKDYWHDAIALLQRDYDLTAEDGLDALRLLRQTGTMRYARQYVEYVEKAGIRGYSPEIVSVLDEGFAKGTIKKSDISFSESYSNARSKVAEVKRNWAADEKEAAGSAKGYLALLTGNSLLSGGEYARAAKMYEMALSKGSIVSRKGVDNTDRAALRLGISQIKLGNSTAAAASFAKVTKPGRTKDVAEFWSIYASNLSKPAPAAAAAAPAS